MRTPWYFQINCWYCVVETLTKGYTVSTYFPAGQAYSVLFQSPSLLCCVRFLAIHYNFLFNRYFQFTVRLLIIIIITNSYIMKHFVQNLINSIIKANLSFPSGKRFKFFNFYILPAGIEPKSCPRLCQNPLPIHSVHRHPTQVPYPRGPRYPPQHHLPICSLVDYSP